jgi:hypothetical protein
MIINDNGIDREATVEEIKSWKSQQAEIDAIQKNIDDRKKQKIEVLDKLGLTAEELLALLS